MINWFVRNAMRQLADHDEHGNPQWQETPEPNPADWTKVQVDDKELPSSNRTDYAHTPHKLGPHSVLWHGSPSDDMTQHGDEGLHVGTYHAAKHALTNVIGHRADGKDWDGTQEYGKTLLMGQDKLMENGLQRAHVQNDRPMHDHYPAELRQYSGEENSLYSGAYMNDAWKPNLFPVKLTQPIHPHVFSDNTANTTMGDYAFQKQEFANGDGEDPGPGQGLAYINHTEDRGSLSVALPHHSHVERLDPNTVQRPDTFRNPISDKHGPMLQQSIDQYKQDIASMKPKGNPWNRSSSENSGEKPMGSMERNIRKNMEIAKKNQQVLPKLVPKALPKTSAVNWFVRMAAVQTPGDYSIFRGVNSAGAHYEPQDNTQPSYGLPVHGGEDWHPDTVNRIENGTATAQELLAHTDTNNPGDYWHHPNHGGLEDAKDYAYTGHDNDDHPGFRGPNGDDEYYNKGYGRSEQHHSGNVPMIFEGHGPKGWNPDDEHIHGTDERFDHSGLMGNSFLPHNTSVPLKAIHYLNSKGEWNTADATGQTMHVAPNPAKDGYFDANQRKTTKKSWFVRTYARWDYDDPNSQLSFSISKAPYVKDNTQIDGYDKIQAHINGKPVGHMLLAPQRVQPDSPHGPGEIADVQVHQDFRGQGLAREMAYHAQENDLWPKHSDTRTPDGDAFAKATPELGFTRKRGSFDPELAEECYDVVQHPKWKQMGLTPDAGFYQNKDHAWLIDKSGNIVDPTAKQFGKVNGPQNDPENYTSYTLHPEKAQAIAHSKGWHEGSAADPEICAQCASTNKISNTTPGNTITDKPIFVRTSDNMTNTPDTSESPYQEHWEPGSTAHYEYHCLESPESSDAHLWYRSHQPVTVLKRNIEDEISNGLEGSTAAERAAEGSPATYKIQFQDGHQGDAWEDELMTHPKHWYRPDPPSMPTKTSFFVRKAGDMTQPIKPQFVRTTPTGNQLSSVPNTGSDLGGDEEVASPFLNKDEEHSGDPEDSGYRARAEWAGFHPMQDEKLPTNWDGHQLS